MISAQINSDNINILIYNKFFIDNSQNDLKK